MKKVLKTLNLLNELVVFKHTIFSASFILIAMVVSSKMFNGQGFFGFKVLVLCTFALIFARNFAMSFNRICDVDIDKTNSRTKNRPSADGRIGYFPILYFCLFNALGFIVVSYFINELAFYLSFPFLFVLGFYSYMKRFSSLGHFVLGLSLGLAPISGDIAVSGDIHFWSICLCIGVLFWVAGFDILYSLQDVEHDLNNSLFSIPAKYGIENSISISRISHLCALFFWALFLSFSDLGLFAIIGLLICACILIYQHWIVKKDFNNIPRAFFNTNGYLGFIFLIFVILDVLFGI